MCGSSKVTASPESRRSPHSRASGAGPTGSDLLACQIVPSDYLRDMESTLSMSRRLASAGGDLLRQAAGILWELAKTMIPILIVVRLLQQAGMIEYLGAALAPLMKLVGLPGSMGLVWASALLTNLYGGIAAFAALAPDASLTVAQATVLCTMMAVAHAIPVEGRIAQRAGARVRTSVVLRIGCALAFGGILHLIYSFGGLLQQPYAILGQSDRPTDPGWALWAWDRLVQMAWIFAIILSLLLLMRLLKRVGILDLLTRFLEPVLRALGISKHAAPLAIIGVTMGLTYGGGLIIQEARSGKLSGRDVVSSLSLMNLCHALIEDTALLVALGAHMSGVFWGRLLLSVATVAVLVQFLARMPDRAFNRVFFRPPAPATDTEPPST